MLGRQYTALVVGCGRIGSEFVSSKNAAQVESHAEVYSNHPRTRLVGVCDSKQDALKRAKLIWKVDGSDDPVELCKQLKPDIVSICTPDHAHFSTAVRILQGSPPKVLFIEKPLASSLVEATELKRIAQLSGCEISVNHTRRFSTAFQTIREEISSGQIGRPIFARFVYGKGLLHNGSHLLDLIRFWFGSPKTVRGFLREWVLGDDSYSADFEFSSGCRVRIDSFDERVGTVFEGDLLTDKLRYQFSLGGLEWHFQVLKDGVIVPGYKNYVPSTLEAKNIVSRNPTKGCLANAITNLVGFLDGEASLICGADDAIAVLQDIDLIRNSAMLEKSQISIV